MWHKTIATLFIGTFLLVLLLGASLWSTMARVQSDEPRLLPTVSRTPGLIVEGQVWLHHEGGPGLAGVKIYRRFASYPGTVVATTRPDGSYQSGFSYIPGDEMVRVWAELTPYAFQPSIYDWRHYHSYEVKTCNFVATAPHSRYLPLLWRRTAGTGPRGDDR
ncbi:MAG: hypothetical protein PVJ34_15260 [Anaerolineae bacterium]|jgi:hypothetical protein